MSSLRFRAYSDIPFKLDGVFSVLICYEKKSMAISVKNYLIFSGKYLDEKHPIVRRIDSPKGKMHFC